MMSSYPILFRRWEIFASYWCWSWWCQQRAVVVLVLVARPSDRRYYCQYTLLTTRCYRQPSPHIHLWELLIQSVPVGSCHRRRRAKSR
jgi:hypothetical protein